MSIAPLLIRSTGNGRPGKRLFGGEGSQVGLKLAGSETFPTGVVHLTYEQASS